MADEKLKLLVLGAHPDDAEYHAGGLASIYAEAGHTVKLVSVTDGRSGHQFRSSEELVPMRRAEAAAAGAVIGATYETWDFPDGSLQPTLEARQRIIREIRTFQPDLVLTHRPNDYHPDHRAVGQLVQDASYMVTVPLVVPDVPPVFKDPIVAYMVDLFTKPCRFMPDVVLDIEDRIDVIARMLACQESQLFEWLAYEEGLLDQVPEDKAGRQEYTKQWLQRHSRSRADHFRDEVVAAYGEQRGPAVNYIEAFELSEYASGASTEKLEKLFPKAVVLRGKRSVIRRKEME